MIMLAKHKPKKIVFDLDGVLRDLSGSVIREYCPGTIADKWNWRSRCGMSLMDYVHKDRSILMRCNPTPYFRVPMYFPDFTIWAVQPAGWREYTENWLDRIYYRNEGYGRKIHVVYYRSQTEKYDALQDSPYTWIVEDTPKWPSYERVILVHQEYNRQAPARVRVSDPEAMRMIIEKKLKG